MIVGTLKLKLLLRDSHSLKEKRRTVRSLKDRLANKFNVAVAEVDHHDVWQTAGIGVTTVGTDTRFVQSVLTNVVEFVRFFNGAELVDYETETFGE